MKKAFTLAEGATHVDICNNSRRAAFTLAEVLITLAIIGVVAAMTIPTLIGNYQKREYVTRLQKAHSMLDKGFRLMLAQEGVERFGDTKFASDYIKANGDYAAIEKAMQDNFSKYFKLGEACCKNSTDGCSMYGLGYSTLKDPGTRDAAISGGIPYFTLADGTTVYMMAIGNSDVGMSGELWIDINGVAKPNTFGRDMFVYIFGDLQNRFIFNSYVLASTSSDTSSNPTDFLNSMPEAFCGTIGSSDVSMTEGLMCADRIILEGWKMNY
ncbi:type II secretion system protein [bacterium]|nr:type II secretion system protein [bacterium]